MTINSPFGENSVFDPSFEWMGAQKDKTKSLTITFDSIENISLLEAILENIYLKFDVTSANLDKVDATFELTYYDTSLGNMKPRKLAITHEIIPKTGSKFIKIKVSKQILSQFGVEIEAKVTCDGISSSTGKFKSDGDNSNDSDNTIITPSSKCFCKNQEWTANDLKYIVTELRKRDAVIEQSQYDEKKNPIYIDSEGKLYYNMNSKDSNKKGYKKYMIKTSLFDRLDDIDKKPLKSRIFFYKSDEFNITPNEATYETFCRKLNDTFKKYNINSCLRRIHFLAQVYVETNRFRTTYEAEPKNTYSGGTYYRGRGLKQITHDYNYLEYYCFQTTDSKHKFFFNLYIKHRTGVGESVVKFNVRTFNQ